MISVENILARIELAIGSYLLLSNVDHYDDVVDDDDNHNDDDVDDDDDHDDVTV
jgi:hypothetical protein